MKPRKFYHNGEIEKCRRCGGDTWYWDEDGPTLDVLKRPGDISEYMSCATCGKSQWVWPKPFPVIESN